MAKKLLSTILKERTETVEYRKIRKLLMIQAENKKNTFFILYITEPTKIMLQNEGIAIEKVNDGCEKYKLSW